MTRNKNFCIEVTCFLSIYSMLLVWLLIFDYLFFHLMDIRDANYNLKKLNVQVKRMRKCIYKKKCKMVIQQVLKKKWKRIEQKKKTVAQSEWHPMSAKRVNWRWFQWNSIRPFCQSVSVAAIAAPMRTTMEKRMKEEKWKA